MKAYVVTTYGPHGLGRQTFEPRGVSRTCSSTYAPPINPLDKMVRDGEVQSRS